MSDKLSNNFKFNIIKHITSKLFEHEIVRLNNLILKLHNKNQELHGPHDAYTYEGYVYRYNDLRGNLKTKFLDYQLHSEMDLFLKDNKLISDDKQEISQILMKLLESCNFYQDYRDALPECIIDTLPNEMRNLSRIMPEAYTIASDNRATRQYEKVLPKIQMYSAMRLIY